MDELADKLVSITKSILLSIHSNPKGQSQGETGRLEAAATTGREIVFVLAFHFPLFQIDI